MKIHCKISLIVIFNILPQLLFAQNPFAGLEFGSPAGSVKVGAQDVSNKQSWDETAYEILNPPYTLFTQFKPTKCKLTYHNGRLYAALCEFARAQFEAIYTNFVTMRQMPKDRDFSRAERSATWYGEFKDGRFADVLNVYESGARAVVSYSDETQKDFRFADLFRGMTPWLILAFVGLFAGYMLFGWLVTSKCPKCKTRKLKVTGKSYDNPKDYDPGLFSRDVHWDEIYHYKCANCGFEKDDVYSGFWSWRNSQE